MANPKSLKSRQAYIDEKPFDGLKISDNTFLNHIEGRHPCPMCNKSRKYFCYTCYVPIEELESKIPNVNLPIKIDIIKHKNEIDGKSTAGHVAILAHNDVTIYTYPDIPSYDSENAVLIYPCHNAITITDLCEGQQQNYDENVLPKGFHHSTLLKSIHKNEKKNIQRCIVNKLPVDKVIFIDSTWNQSKGIYKDQRFSNLRCVVLQNRISQFWRHQKGSPRWYLSTVEAVHQFLVEFHVTLWGYHPSYDGLRVCFSNDWLNSLKEANGTSDLDNSYKGEYDDLLFFFQHMYNLIHSYYEHDVLHAYKRRLS